jgi:hypothetical protein
MESQQSAETSDPIIDTSRGLSCDIRNPTIAGIEVTTATTIEAAHGVTGNPIDFGPGYNVDNVSWKSNCPKQTSFTFAESNSNKAIDDDGFDASDLNSATEQMLILGRMNAGTTACGQQEHIAARSIKAPRDVSD